ncbi:MAG: LptF/LptG family permease [Flavobacteriaceae bacterium]|jgi:lipopolysaccharide export system permease protein|nr:LptF/LptG family permease [Flavobacteriaceae bacterium]
MFIFIFQSIWLYIDNLAGKGLDLVIIGKFIFYLLPNLTEKVLPLTVLLSSILTFGTFAEHYEFAAMKASGISLQRSMRTLIVLVSFLGLVTFFFADRVIPAAELKSYSLKKNIAKVKPAVAIAEGLFSEFEGTGMTILVQEKYGENDRFLRDVIIHKKNPNQINNTVIKAKEGELISSENSNLIQLKLIDGHYYESLSVPTQRNHSQHPFAVSNFESYIINIDLTELNMVDMDEEISANSDKMKNVVQLRTDMDSISDNNAVIVTALSKNITERMGLQIINTPLSTKQDSLFSKMPADSLKSIPNILEGFNPVQKTQLVSEAINTVTMSALTIQTKRKELLIRYKIYNMHALSLHKKYALGLSCIVLFFVGAPLGAIIRKGGLGLPMVIAIILFLTYYFLGVFTYNYAKEGNISPFFGAWIPTLIMLPLGIFLTRRATADKGMVQFGSILDFLKLLFTKQKA